MHFPRCWSVLSFQNRPAPQQGKRQLNFLRKDYLIPFQFQSFHIFLITNAHLFHAIVSLRNRVKLHFHLPLNGNSRIVLNIFLVLRDSFYQMIELICCLKNKDGRGVTLSRKRNQKRQEGLNAYLHHNYEKNYF